MRVAYDYYSAYDRCDTMGQVFCTHEEEYDCEVGKVSNV